MKKIYVQAYCQQNLGDDLFVLQLARRYPEHRFYVYAVGTNQRAFRGEKNIVLPNFFCRIRRKLTHLLRIPRREIFDGMGADAKVIIGGSILWEGAPLNFATEEIPAFLVGANCEQSYCAEFLPVLRRALSRLEGCSFRDCFSWQQVQPLLGSTYAPDVLYDWHSDLPTIQGRGIGISVVSGKGCFRDEAVRRQYHRVIAELCNLCTEQNLPVGLFGFCQSEGDDEAMQQILTQVNVPQKVSCILYRGDPQEILSAMNQYESILATRFHAMILGWVLGKNVVPIIYSAKQTHVLKDAEFHGAMWNALEGECPDAQKLLADIQSQTGRLDISSLKTSARQQFSGLDSWLKK